MARRRTTVPPEDHVGEAKPFDLLGLLAAFARTHELALDDPTLIERFSADAARRLQTALKDPALLHGARTERLFEAMILSLGRFKLFKAEDIGRVHPAGLYRAPDFRVVLEDGEQWLIEVKNVRRPNPNEQHTTLTAPYLKSLRAYCEAVGAPLRIALFWSTWNLWALIDPDRFARRDGGVRITMEESIRGSELARLGDVSIMTKPPLRFVLNADMDKPRSLNSEGIAEFMIGSASLFSGEVELTDPADSRLAAILLQYGEWDLKGPLPLMGTDGVVGAQFVATPHEPSDQGFDGIGWASRIFSRYYASQTFDGARIVQLNGKPAPEWFEPLAKWDFGVSKLPLWLLHLQASYAEPPGSE